MMKRRDFGIGLCGCVLTGLTGCMAHCSGPATEVADRVPGQRPEMDSDEAGLWMAMDKLEKSTRRSRKLVRDKEINDLVADVTCRVSVGHCADLRPYVIRIPHFNATMHANGMVQVWTGLLLRCRNESQLAAILGHEYGHFLKRHSLQRMRDTREKVNLSQFLQIGLAAFGAPPGIGDMANLMLSASLNGFSRDNEREADAVGLTVAAAAGYDPFEAAEIWRRLVAEDAAAGLSEHFDVFTATHPMSEERIETLARIAEERGHPKNPAPDRLKAAVSPIRAALMTDQIELGQFKRSDALFGMLLEDGDPPGEILHYRGELYRRRGKGDDDAAALDFYLRALAERGAMPESHRGAGLILWRKGDKQTARDHFRRYLDARPEAPDRDALKFYLGEV